MYTLRWNKLHAESISYTPSRVVNPAESGQPSTEPATDVVAAALQDQASPSQPYRREGPATSTDGPLTSAPELSAGSSVSASTLAPKIPAATATVTFASAMQAASFQMLPIRFVCAVGIAAAATSYDWFMPGVALPVQVMVANIVLIFSVAWMLKKDPERCRSILKQVHLRQGTFLDSAFGIVARVTRAPAWIMRIGFTVAWALYVDSGTYIAAAIVFYLLSSTNVEPPLQDDLTVE